MNVAYEIQVRTSNRKDAGTDANIFLTLKGDKGTSPEIKLDNAEDNFEKNKLDTFLPPPMEDVGNISEITLRHDNSGDKGGWHVNYVQVRRTSDGAIFMAMFDRWLAKDQEDKKLTATKPAQQTFKPETQTSKPVVYEIQILTSDKEDAGTDANVFVALMGANGRKTLEIKLDNDEDNFERNKLDLFRLPPMEDLGNIAEITLRNDNSGKKKGWHVNYALVRRTTDGEAFIAKFDRWLAVDEADKKLCVAKPAHRLMATEAVDHKFDTKFEFHFVNSFQAKVHLPGRPVDEKWGFCGGMSAGSLRRFRDGINAPAQIHVPPPPTTPLYKEIWERQVKTLTADGLVLPRIILWNDPRLTPDSSDVWGVPILPHSIGNRTKEDWDNNLHAELRKGPEVMVLMVPGSLTDNHQVLAVGFNYYNESNDLIFKVYDPNIPDTTQLIACNIRGTTIKKVRYLATGNRVRGFFWNECTEPAVSVQPVLV